VRQTVHLAAAFLVILVPLVSLPAACGSGSGPAGSAPPPAAGAATVTVKNVGGRGAPRPPWLAWNDGDGPWRLLEGNGPSYVFHPASGRYGVAIACEEDDGRLSVSVTHAVTDELPVVIARCSEPAAETNASLGGTITGAADGDEISLGLSSGDALTVRALRGPRHYELFLDAGVLDVAGLAESAGVPAAALVRRGVSVSGDTTLDLDFAADALPLVARPLSIQNVDEGARQVTARVTWRSERGASLTLHASERNTQYHAVAAGAMAAGDSQTLSVASIDNGYQLRGAARRFRASEAMTVVLPFPFAPTAVTRVPAGAYVLPSMTFEPYPGAVYYSLSAGSNSESRGALFSSRWLGQQRSYTFPDLSGLPGWKAVWGFAADAAPTMMVMVVAGNRGLAATLDITAEAAEGIEEHSSVRLIPPR
jgi:hypothetical protein